MSRRPMPRFQRFGSTNRASGSAPPSGRGITAAISLHARSRTDSGLVTRVLGPEPRADRSRPRLVIDVARPTGIDALQLSFDANHRVTPEALVLDPTAKSVISVPEPDITTLVRPLGDVVPPA